MLSIIVALFVAVPAAPPAMATPAPSTTSFVVGDPIRFTVVVMDKFGDKRLLGVVRRSVGPNHQDLLIVKRSELTPEFVVSLAKAMVASFTRHGTAPVEQVNMYFMRKHSWPPISAAERAWATQLIAQLQVAQRRAFTRIGLQPAVDTVFGD